MKSAKRVRVTVTLSPRVVGLLDSKTTAEKSRSQVVEECVLDAQRRGRLATLRQAIDDYYAEPAGEDAFWQQVARSHRERPRL
jgi:hypothetical protein